MDDGAAGPLLIEKYLEHVRVEKRLAQRTVELYALDLRKLGDNADKAGVELTRVQNAHIRRWVAQMPGIEAAPTREDQRDAAAAAARTVHLRDPAPDVRVLHAREFHAGLVRVVDELLQVERIKLHRALRQA